MAYREYHTTMRNSNTIILAIMCLILASCKTTKTIEIPVEVPKIEKEYINKTDSIFIHDSIHHYIYSKSDTVFSEIVKYRYKYLVKRDTILMKDTLYKTKTLTNTVEKKIRYVPIIYKILAGIGSAALLLLGIKLKFKF